MSGKHRGWSRRELIQLSSAAGASAFLTMARGGIAAVDALPAGARADGPEMSARLVLSQERWSAAQPRRDLRPLLQALHSERRSGRPEQLVLLPQAEAPQGRQPDEDKFFAALARLAREQQLYLTGSARLATRAGVATVGFMFDERGTLMLRAVKATPDCHDGFSDSTAALGQPAQFHVASTPFGKVGLLVGEDLLIPGLVRGAMLNGAELLLNPGLGAVPGSQAEALAELPTAVAYENWFVVARATPATRDVDGFLQRLPALTGVFDWQGNVARAVTGETALYVPFHASVLRQARAHLSNVQYDNYPVLLRDALFGAVYTQMAAARGAASVPETRADWWREAQQRIAAQDQRETPVEQLLDRYYAVAVQPAPTSPLPKASRRAAQFDNIRYSLGLLGPVPQLPDVKLVVFPEFCFSGAGYRTVEDVLSVAVRLPGPELDILSEFAQRTSSYVAGQFLEEDPKFPQRVFNTAFLLNDSGDLILKHRKLQGVDTLGALRVHTPGSIFEAYVDEFGLESLYAIADTPLGKLGHMICFETVFPEVSRLLAQAGAELIIHSTSEGWGSLRSMWHALRRKRALENTAYLLMSNTGFDPTRPGLWRPYGESQFIDYFGKTRDQLAHNAVDALTVLVDMSALRAARSDPAVNTLIWDEPASYATAYSQGKGVPNDIWRGDPLAFPYADKQVLKDVHARFYERGVYTR